jgi:hypothetical protein
VNPITKTANPVKYPFKRISLANVLELDDQPSHLFRRPNKQKWVEACNKPKLESCVPQEIAFLYETTRGAMVYGMFFQPIASLAAEQCYRVLEAGARQLCDRLGLLPRKSGKGKDLPQFSFADTFVALDKAGKIPEQDRDPWKRIQFLRNRYSHPKSQIIQSDGSPQRTLAYTAELLNRLFK